MRENTLKCIEEHKLIAIVRSIETSKLLALADALYGGGIRMMEVTFDQSKPEIWSDTADGITSICKKFGDKMAVGAGTVTSTELVDLACDAGAQYIISPDLNKAVIARTLERGMVSMPGVLTPSEIMTAHATGADYVKVFPSGTLGASYVKAIRAPISHVKMLAVGGISENNLEDFLKAGMSGAGIGGNLVNKEWIEADEFHKITALAQKLTTIVKGCGN